MAGAKPLAHRNYINKATHAVETGKPGNLYVLIAVVEFSKDNSST